MRFVIVGSGPAGIFAAEAIRKREQKYPITMVAQDHAIAHSPVMLTYWMAGNRPRESTFFRDASWADKNMIEVKLGQQASAIDTISKRLILANGENISYDRLLIATGSSPIFLPIPGTKAKGITTLRYVKDAEMILSGGHDVREIVIIGGGFIGLKLACHLKERGFDVSVFEKEPKLAARVLDKKASFLIENSIFKQGIRVKTRVEVAEILNAKGWVTAVVLKDGQSFPCQRVVQAVGVIPNAQFLDGSGIKQQGGCVPVNDHMETNIQDIYAAGDITMTINSITSAKINNAVWPAASRQGLIAGCNMAGGNQRYIHNFQLNALNLFGLRVMSAGQSYYEKEPGVDVCVTEGGESYRKVVVQDGRVIGFLLLGNVSGAGLLLSVMKKKAEIPCDPADLLNSLVFVQDRLSPNLGYQHGLLFNALGE